MKLYSQWRDPPKFVTFQIFNKKVLNLYLENYKKAHDSICRRMIYKLEKNAKFKCS